MGRNEKIRTAVITIIMFVIALLFFMSRSTDLSYNDWWIKGKTIEEVERKYGEAINFDDGQYGYYLGVDNSPPMPSRKKMYYVMFTDDNGIVVSVKKSSLPILKNFP